MVSDPTPAFQFYPRDFVADFDVAGMTLEQVGAYMLLLCYAWLKDGLPADDVKLAKSLHVTPKKFRSLWISFSEKFPTATDGRRRNPRMEDVRTEQAEYRRKCEERAKKAASERWGGKSKHSKRDATSTPKAMPKNAPVPAPASTAPTEQRTPLNRSPVQAFLDWFYAEYERASDGQKCLPKWAKHGSLVKPILATYGERRARELAWVFLRYDCDKWGKVPRTVEAFHGWIESVPMYEAAALRTWGLTELDDARLGLAPTEEVP